MTTTSGGEATAERLARLRERLVDHLYGTLDEAGRRELDAALAELPELREEADALARALRVSRRALRAAEEPAPAAVRARVLEAAAREASRLRAPGERRAPASAAASPGGALAGLVAWLRRPWAYGLVGAAAALALLVMARGQWSERGELREAIEGSARPRSTPAAPAAFAPGAPAELAPGAMREQAESEAAPAELRAAAPAAVPAAEPAAKPRPLKSSADGARTGAPVSRGRQLQRDRDANELGATTDEGFAQPPSGWVGGGAGRATSGAAARASSQAAAPGAAPDGARPAAPAAAGPARDRASAAERSTAARAEEREARDEREKKDSQGADATREQLLRRVEELLSAGRSAEAAEVYRELARRFPRDRAAAHWRARAEALRVEAEQVGNRP